jgi:ribosomal protein S18 acetylase RimI-like enzyme
MELRESELEAFCRFFGEEGADRRAARIRDAVARGERELADTRVAKDAAGAIRAALRLVPLGGATYLLAGPFGDDASAAPLVADALRHARGRGARLVRSRPDAATVGPRYRAALLEQGFAQLDERIEFERSVADLPRDDGSPLTWRDLAAVGRAEAAAMLRAVAVGDPHSDDESDDPEVALAEWLAAPGLTNGPDCVQIGYLKDRAVAFVCAQANPETGWSRITYLGVVPDARGRGLGTWVHRRGFRMLADQGGRAYHGGTAARNEAMVRLFRAHGCKESRRMLELEWHADR